ncbi:MAG: pirin family protein [Thermodesulfobacteriota bacterium]
MSATRKIRKAWKSKPTIEGAGVHLKRVFGFGEVPLFDPFLLLDDFRSDRRDHYIKGFPWHPHRGIETITYVLEGEVEHADSLGNRGTIASGDIQWMTAGSGIIHQEMPRGDRQGRMYGFQLWANLPASRKMMPPRYRDVKSSQIPEIALPSGTKIRIIAGRVGNQDGPVADIVISPQYLDISVPAKSEFTHTVIQGHTVFAYVIQGQGYFCTEKNPFSYEIEGSNYFDIRREPFVGNETLVLFEDGDEIAVSTEEHPVRFLLISGQPIGEPVAWYGPIVMNTREELRLAFEEFKNGTFIKHSAQY